MTSNYFRIGPGYVEYWMHETTHWRTTEAERVAIQELGESITRLIRQRDAVQNARRAFMPASSLPVDERPSTAMQEAMFHATHDFFLTYYSTLSAFASLLTRFRAELGNVPHRSNAKFIGWMAEDAMWSESAIPTLQEARQFRALLDHKASHQPYRWGTTETEGGLVRIMLHGPGSIPEGAMQRLDTDDRFPPEDTWTFVAPDEDLVLSSLAVQLNAFFPRVQPHRFDNARAVRCTWELRLSDADPRGGYPILAHASGTVVRSEPQGIVLTKEDQAKIDVILARYFEKQQTTH